MVDAVAKKVYAPAALLALSASKRVFKYRFSKKRAKCSATMVPNILRSSVTGRGRSSARVSTPRVLREKLMGRQMTLLYYREGTSRPNNGRAAAPEDSSSPDVIGAWCLNTQPTMP